MHYQRVALPPLDDVDQMSGLWGSRDKAECRVMA